MSTRLVVEVGVRVYGRVSYNSDLKAQRVYGLGTEVVGSVVKPDMEGTFKVKWGEGITTSYATSYHWDLGALEV